MWLYLETLAPLGQETGEVKYWLFSSFLKHYRSPMSVMWALTRREAKTKAAQSHSCVRPATPDSVSINYNMWPSQPASQPASAEDKAEKGNQPSWSTWHETPCCHKRKKWLKWTTTATQQWKGIVSYITSDMAFRPVQLRDPRGQLSTWACPGGAWHNCQMTSRQPPSLLAAAQECCFIFFKCSSGALVPGHTSGANGGQVVPLKEY